jgi:hypothetical protein
MSRDDPAFRLSWADPVRLAGLGGRLDSAERRITAERSREVVIWTDKDHRELKRLLKKATLYVASREPYLVAYTGPSGHGYHKQYHMPGYGYHMAALLDVAESISSRDRARA